jgi:hypothetical protein
MKKRTRDFAIIGGIGLGAFLLLRGRQAQAAQPFLTAPAPSSPTASPVSAVTGALTAITGAFSSLFGGAGAPAPTQTDPSLFNKLKAKAGLGSLE